MSLNYSLEMATELTPSEALQLLADQLGLEWGDATSVAGAGIWISAVSTQRLDEYSLSNFKKDYGFRPTLSIGFQVQESGNGTTYEELYREGYTKLGGAVAALLSHATGNAVMLANHEHVILRQRDGKLVLNEGWEEEIAPQISAAGLSYELQQLCSPALEEHAPTAA